MVLDLLQAGEWCLGGVSARSERKRAEGQGGI